MYTMCGVACIHRTWTPTKRDLAAHARTHFHGTMGAHWLTQLLTKTLHTWLTATLDFHFWFRHSMGCSSLAMREQLAHTPLRHHSCVHSYLPTLSPHGQLYKVYTRQPRTFGGAPVHHLAMVHLRYRK